MGKNERVIRPTDKVRKKIKAKESKKNKEKRDKTRAEILSKKSTADLKRELVVLEKKESEGCVLDGKSLTFRRLIKEILSKREKDEKEKKNDILIPALPNKMELEEMYPDAEGSIYYDVVTNPYGVPPHGQPQIWKEGYIPKAERHLLPETHALHPKNVAASVVEGDGGERMEDEVDLLSKIPPPPLSPSSSDENEPKPPPPNVEDDRDLVMRESVPFWDLNDFEYSTINFQGIDMASYYRQRMAMEVPPFANLDFSQFYQGMVPPPVMPMGAGPPIFWNIPPALHPGQFMPYYPPSMPLMPSPFVQNGQFLQNNLTIFPADNLVPPQNGIVNHGFFVPQPIPVPLSMKDDFLPKKKLEAVQPSPANPAVRDPLYNNHDKYERSMSINHELADRGADEGNIPPQSTENGTPSLDNSPLDEEEFKRRATALMPSSLKVKRNTGTPLKPIAPRITTSKANEDDDKYLQLLIKDL